MARQQLPNAEIRNNGVALISSPDRLAGPLVFRFDTTDVAYLRGTGEFEANILKSNDVVIMLNGRGVQGKHSDGVTRNLVMTTGDAYTQLQGGPSGIKLVNAPGTLALGTLYDNTTFGALTMTGIFHSSHTPPPTDAAAYTNRNFQVTTSGGGEGGMSWHESGVSGLALYKKSGTNDLYIMSNDGHNARVARSPNYSGYQPVNSFSGAGGSFSGGGVQATDVQCNLTTAGNGLVFVWLSMSIILDTPGSYCQVLVYFNGGNPMVKRVSCAVAGAIIPVEMFGVYSPGGPSTYNWRLYIQQLGGGTASIDSGTTCVLYAIEMK